MNRAIDEIKYRLCDELSVYADKPRWTERDVEMIDRLTHSIKSLMKYIEMEENWNDKEYEDRSYASRGRSRGRYYYDDGYEDRRYDDMPMSRNHMRENNTQGMVEELEQMMNSTTDADMKEAMKKTLTHLKKMNK